MKRLDNKGVSPLISTTLLLFAGIAIGAIIFFGTNSIQDAKAFLKGPQEQLSPYNHIKEQQIKVYNKGVTLDILKPSWSRFEATKSMDPTIDIGTNAIEITPMSREDLHVGDIVSYDSEYTTKTLAHRIIDIKEDNEGWYAIIKGDNNLRPDPGRIRFHQIKTIIVSLIY